MDNKAEKIRAASFNQTHLQDILDITKERNLCYVETEFLNTDLVRTYYFDDESSITTIRHRRT